MLNSIKKLIMISRPISWLNTAYPFAAGYIFTAGDSVAILVIGSLYFLIPYNLLMYGINDVFDYESDIKNPRKGGIEGMREQRAFHPMIIKACIITNLPFVIYLVAVGDGLANIVLAAVLFMVIAYSVAKLRFKERPVLDSITSSSHFVGPLVYGLALGGWVDGAWPYVIAFFCWGMASHAFGAVQDIKPDRKGGIKSIATQFGARATVRFAFLFYLAATVILAFQSLQGLVVGLFGLLYIANIYPYLNVTDKTSHLTNTAWKRFIWLNYLTGFIVTLVILMSLLN